MELCITAREDPADALAVNRRFKDYGLEAMPEGSRIGTSSLRRLAQLRHHYPHLAFKDVRGNVLTRLEKLDAGLYDGLVLAAAGLERLRLAGRIHQVIAPEISLHAVGQGALGIECVADNQEVLEQIRVLSHGNPGTAAWRNGPFCGNWRGSVRCPSGSTAPSTARPWRSPVWWPVWMAKP